MTRQEAIEDLKLLRFNHNVMINGTNHTSKALDMAIEALELMEIKQQATKASDCISRQATIDVLHEYFDGMLETDTWSPCVVYGLIEVLPSAEPERKKGQWIWCTSSDHLKCSECGTKAPMYMDYADGDYQEWLSDFCPECGCEMKGFEEDE